MSTSARSSAAHAGRIIGEGLEPGPEGHPFRYEYIGLGLLDRTSIHLDGDAWAAAYPDGHGDPYLVVRVRSDGRTTLDETDELGRRVASATGRTLEVAIGQLGLPAVAEPVHDDLVPGWAVSRFWVRVARRTPGAWICCAPGRIPFAHVPAIGIGTLSVPVPRDAAWVEPAPGPLASRIGLGPVLEPGGPVDATLWRWFVGLDEPEATPTSLYRYFVPGILVGEIVAGIMARNGPLRSIEWRPFLHHDLPMLAGGGLQRWGVPASRPEHRLGLVAFGIEAPPLRLELDGPDEEDRPTDA